jgi:hypothetical protein
MADETLLTAARRFVRFFDIDMSHGGIVSTDTQYARDLLSREIEREAKREKAQQEQEAACPRKD